MMELYEVPYLDAPYLNLMIMSDIHVGCENWQEKILDNDILAVKEDPFARVIIPGDLFQRDLKNHKVGNVYHQAIPPGEQKYYLSDKLAPIKDKIIGACSGNHDDRTAEDNTDVRDLCKFLDVKFFDDEICISLSVGYGNHGKPSVYTGYGVHGSSNGSMVGSIANALAKLPNVCDADFYFQGHSHQPIWFPLSWFRRDMQNKHMINVVRHFIAGGSYQGRDPYPVKKAMTPRVLGSPVVVLSGTDKAITVKLPNMPN
jgi:predicted phosphodiesterase